MPQRQCAAITKAGVRCRAPALPNDDQCFTHSPATATARTERNRRGGHNKDTNVRAAKALVAMGREIEFDDLPALLLGMAGSVAAGELQPAQASAIAQLVKTAITIDAHLKWGRRLADLQSTLAEIERIGSAGERRQRARRAAS